MRSWFALALAFRRPLSVLVLAYPALPAGAALEGDRIGYCDYDSSNGPGQAPRSSFSMNQNISLSDVLSAPLSNSTTRILIPQQSL